MDTLYTLMPLILLVAIMYFLLIRPQKKREKQVNAMRANIKAGDDIVTIGGIYGTVTKIKDDKLIIQLGADRTKIEIARWAISKVVNDEPATTAPVRAKRGETADNEETETPKKKSRPKKLEKTGPSISPEKPEANPLEDE
ncbi:MAG: preprotein translocase subunit YajC [Eubacteriales bacterium]|nr:preprotein translocase subunit YajC [Eubacteriales bacterium]MDD4582757.1 preprotein translocase subunit YajC [Eubacteriales bacterium]